MRESGATKLVDDVRIDFRRRGKIEETVATDIFCRFQFDEALGKVGVSLWIGIVAWAVMKVCRESVPLLRIDGPDFGDALGSFAKRGAKRIFGHGRTGEADDGVTRSQAIVNGEVVHGRNDFALGEVSGGAEENNGARLSDAAVN